MTKGNTELRVDTKIYVENLLERNHGWQQATHYMKKQYKRWEEHGWGGSKIPYIFHFLLDEFGEYFLFLTLALS